MTELLETAPGDALFTDWCGVWTACGLDERPDDPPRPVSDHEAVARQLLTPGTARTGTHRAAVQDRRVVGALRVLAPTQDNPTTAVVDVAVHPAHRRRGTGTLLLAEGERLAAGLGRTALLAEVDEAGRDAPGRLFAEHHGWSCDLVETRRDLVLPVDRERLDRLEREAAPHAAGYRVVTWRDRTPDELLEDRALLEARMSVDAPHGDLPVELEHWDGARIREYEQMHVDRGRTVLSAGAIAPDGRLVAFTDLQVPLADPRHASQGGTLVLREHRGHRLGALVKAAVLRRLDEVPGVQRISTYNSETNRPMVAVNEALGFVPAGALSTWSRTRS